MLAKNAGSNGSLALHAEKLSKRFGPRLLFRNLTFRVIGARSVAVTGANGSGKSTLLRLLAGLTSPTGGHVELRINGRAVSPDDHPLHAGLVAPYLNVYDGFTPRENLRFLARARSLNSAELRINEVLGFTSLTERADDPVSTFSSGMKQRIKYAAALLSNPPLLLLDEPHVNLDAAGLEMVTHVADRQRERAGLLVVATNDEAEADRYDDVIRIEDFR